MNKIQQDLVPSHVAYIYEDICREKMWQLNNSKIFPFYFEKVGSFWDNNTEISLLALSNASKEIIFGECKYTNRPQGPDLFNKLQEKAKVVSWNRETRKEYYVFFSINGFTEEMQALQKQRGDIFLFS